MAHTTIATAADYADAMITARHARNWLFWILFLVLALQIAVFFVARYTDAILVRDSALPAATDLSIAPPAAAPATPVDPATPPADPAAAPATPPVEAAPVPAPEAPAVSAPLHTPVAAITGTQSTELGDVLQYLTNGSALLGIVALAIFAVLLLLIIQIMLIGRLIGVAQVTGAFIWVIVLAVLIFPWQAYLNFPGIGDTSFRLPGALYTWSELVASARFPGEAWQPAALKWARFVGFPLMALLILITAQIKSRRGLRLALGETEPAIIETSVPNL